MKKIMLISFVFLIIVSIMTVTCMPASALGRFDSEWGTESDGITLPPTFRINLPGFYESCPGTSGFPNADFEQGLKYWMSNTDEKPSNNAKIVEENGNKFLRLSGDEAFDGIESARFVDSRVKVGDSLAIMYDWRADDPSFQIVLKQYLTEPGTIKLQRLSMRTGVNVVEAYTDQEWNTTVTQVETNEFPTSRVLEPENEAKAIYLSFLLEISNPSTVVDIDNLKLVIYNKTTGKIKDLDGKELYDTKNLKGNVVEEVLKEEDFAGIDYNALSSSDKAELSPVKEDNKNSEKTSENKDYTMIIILIVGAVIVVGAAAVVLIIVKRKKNSAPLSETENEDSPDESIPTEE